MVSQAKLEKIEKGVAAWEAGQPYHDCRRSAFTHEALLPCRTSIELRRLRGAPDRPDRLFEVLGTN